MFRRQATSDDRLLAATGSDASAFAQFYDRYESGIVGYFIRRTHDAELAADLTAEVFAAALAAAGSYRVVGQTATPWLFTIARNTLVNSIRRGQVEETARREIGMLQEIELRGRTI